MKKFYGKPVGNDRKAGKVTFVTKYGLEKAKSDLEEKIRKSNKRTRRIQRKSRVFKRTCTLYKNKAEVSFGRNELHE